MIYARRFPRGKSHRFTRRATGNKTFRGHSKPKPKPKPKTKETASTLHFRETSSDTRLNRYTSEQCPQIAIPPSHRGNTMADDTPTTLEEALFASKTKRKIVKIENTRVHEARRTCYHKPEGHHHTSFTVHTSDNATIVEGSFTKDEKRPKNYGH